MKREDGRGEKGGKRSESMGMAKKDGGGGGGGGGGGVFFY